MTNNVPMIGGAVTYWNISQETDRQRLLDNMRVIGFDKFVPEPRTAQSSLAEALRSCYGNPETLVRPLEKRSENGFAVVKEVRGDRLNQYVVLRTAKVFQGNIELKCNDGNNNLVSDYDYDLVKTFQAVSATLSNDAISKMLVAIVDELQGTSLKRSGGVYYVPESSMGPWVAVAEVVEQAAIGNPSSVQLLRTVVDENSVRAVKEAVHAEAIAVAAEINAEVAKGGMGVKALQSREIRTVELHKKLRVYEGLLGEALTAAHDAVNVAAQAAAAAMAQSEHQEGGTFEGSFDDLYKQVFGTAFVS